MNARSNALQAQTLVRTWMQLGLRDAVLSPGSRSAPLALALAEAAADKLAVHVNLDERSASFFALGLAKWQERPVVVLCTSGTAAANFHPAVLEAFHARVPLIVCTADRPSELHQVGAPQTIEQAGLFGGAVRWSFTIEAPPAHAGGAQSSLWSSLAGRAWAESLGPPCGPVHLNLAYREPLVPPAGSALAAAPPLPPLSSGYSLAPSTLRAAPSVTRDLAEAIKRRPHGLLVAGWGAGVSPSTALAFCKTAGWPLLADPLSGLRQGPLAVSTYDALARLPDVAARLAPELVVRIGAPLTSKEATRFLSGFPTVLVDPWRSWQDPERSADLIIAADPEHLLLELAELLQPGAAPGWSNSWMAAESTARTAIDRTLDSWSEPFEGRIARDLMAGLPEGSALVVASSMPVRDLESFAAPRGGVDVMANRGVNGIDGFVSTALGVAAARPGQPTAALMGDLCFLHDSNGLLPAARRGVNTVMVVVDNAGGGIFSFLPQAGHPEQFELLFGTPQDIDLERLAEAYGLAVSTVDSAAELRPAVIDALGDGGVSMVRVRTERQDNLQRHRECWNKVAEALGARPLRAG